MDTIHQLVDIYFKEEWWHKNRMSQEKAYNYHKQMYEQGNIQVYEDMGLVLGYYQVYFVNSKQLEDLVMNRPFHELTEDIRNGNIAYLANLWIDKPFRKGSVFKTLYTKFFEQCRNCKMIVGEEQPRKGRLRIFRNGRSRWEKKSQVEKALQ